MTYMFILKCALKLVLKNILYYDARSEKHQIIGLTFLPLAALGRVHFRKRDALPNYEITSIMYSEGFTCSALSTWLVTAVVVGRRKTFHVLHCVRILTVHILTNKRHKLKHITKHTSY